MREQRHRKRKRQRVLDETLDLSTSHEEISPAASDIDVSKLSRPVSPVKLTAVAASRRLVVSDDDEEDIDAVTPPERPSLPSYSESPPPQISQVPSAPLERRALMDFVRDVLETDVPVKESCELDIEDVYYIQLALEDITASRSVEQLKSPTARRVHESGCARAEGYYSIPDEEKSKYLPHRNPTKFVQKAPVDSGPVGKKLASSRMARINQRRLLVGMEEVKGTSDVLSFNQLKARKKHLKFAKSKIHDWGLFAMERIERNEMVIEYIGQLIRQRVADLREKEYEKKGIGSSYLFRLDEDLVVDATMAGNLARFINHCCDVHSSYFCTCICSLLPI